MLLHAEYLITTLPRALGLNKKQSAMAAYPLWLNSIFPQGTALSQTPSIMHQNLHYKSPQIEQSDRLDKEQSTEGRESKRKNSQDEKYPVFLSDAALCFSLFVLLFELYVHVSRGTFAKAQVIRHPNWLCLESNCCCLIEKLFHSFWSKQSHSSAIKGG